MAAVKVVHLLSRELLLLAVKAEAEVVIDFDGDLGLSDGGNE
jgi:hypothetical protein